MAIFNKRVKFTKEQLLGHFLTRNSITDVIYSIIRVVCIVFQNLYCIPSYLVLSWLVLLPISWFRSDLYSRLENYLYNSLMFIVSSWSLAAGVTIVEAGDEFKHLIEEPNLSEQKTKTAENPAHDYESSRRIRPTSDNSVNYSKRYADNQIESKHHRKNGYITNKSNGLKCNEHTTHTRPKAELTNSIVHRVTDTTNGVMNSASNLNNNHNPAGDHPIENVTADARKASINNNNNICENNHDTARKCSQCINIKPVRVSPRESTLTTQVLNDRIEQRTSKSIQVKPRILFLCNHVSTADVPLIMQSFSTLTNQSILWVLDAQFKATNFGVVCGSHGDFFVTKNLFADGSLREHVLKYADRNLLVLFPEGGFLRKRIEGSNRFATKNGLPFTKYVTHPRFGAFKDLIDPSVGVTHIVDATLMYDDIENPLSILDIILGNRKQPAILNYKVYKRSEINPTEEWLRGIWLEKDKLLSRFYENRASVLKELDNTFRVAVLDWFKTLSVHLFYFLVCYLAIFRLFNATSVTMLKARELYYSNI